MRKTMLAIMTLAAAGVASVAGSAPAAAYDYPYCLQGRGIGIPGECSYQTYAQCQASASGRGLYCNINPRVAFARQQQPRVRYYRTIRPAFAAALIAAQHQQTMRKARCLMAAGLHAFVGPSPDFVGRLYTKPYG